MSSVLVFVEGGVVQNVITDDRSIDIYVLDADEADSSGGNWPTVLDHRGGRWEIGVHGDYQSRITRQWVGIIDAAISRHEEEI